MSVASSSKAIVHVQMKLASTPTLGQNWRSSMEKWWLAVRACFNRVLTMQSLSGLLRQLQGKVQQRSLQVLSSQSGHSRTAASKRPQPGINQRSAKSKDFPTGLCTAASRSDGSIPNIRTPKLPDWSWREAIGRHYVWQHLSDNVPQTPRHGHSFSFCSVQSTDFPISSTLGKWVIVQTSFGY